MPDERKRGFATRAVHGARTPPVEQTPASVPLYQTSTWRLETTEEFAEAIAFRRPGFVYTRGYGNPTIDAFQGLMADLEGHGFDCSIEATPADNPFGRLGDGMRYADETLASARHVAAILRRG